MSLLSGLAAFMRAYCDESGKHAQAEMITIAGLVLRNRDAKILQRQWPKALGDVPMPYHHSDFLARKRPFDGFSDAEIERTQADLIAAISKVEYMGFGASLVRSAWDRHVHKIRPPELKDPWYFVFESAITEVMDRTAEAGRLGRITFVFDRQDEFKDKATDLYNQIIQLKDLPFWSRLGGLTFEAKDKVCPLQAADMFVYEANLHARETRIKRTQPERWQMRKFREGIAFSDYMGGVIWNDQHVARIAEMRQEELSAHARSAVMAPRG